MYPSPIQKLIDLFSKFPTVGPRTAVRFVFYLLRLPNNELNDLLETINKLSEKIKICYFCFNPFEISEEKEICQICSDPNRDRTLLCVVEKESDLITIEKTQKYKGLYFILGGTLSNLKKEDVKKLKIEELEERIKSPEKFGILNCRFEEIILAFNLTIEGESTALYLQRRLESMGIKISRLGRGLPTGGELEYADKETLCSALETRRES